jgi:prolyl oligopeptidase
VTTHTSNSDAVIDVYHGIEVSDPFRWLETEETQTQDWRTSQAATCASYFNQPRITEQLREEEKRLRPFLEHAKIVRPVLFRGGCCFFAYKEADAQQACIVSQAGPELAREVLVSPDGRREGDFVSVELLDVSPGLKWLAYSVRVGGSHQLAVEILDLESRTVHEWSLPEGYLRSFQFEGDLCVRYIHEDGQAPRPFLRQEERQGLTPDYNAHKVNHIAGESKNLRFLAQYSPALELGIYYIFRLGKKKHETLFLRNRKECGAPMALIVDDFEHRISFQLQRDAVYFCTDYNAPNKRICRLDIQNPLIETATVIVPECADTIVWWKLCAGSIFVTYSRQLINVTEVWSLEGTLLATVDYGAEGSADPLGADVDHDRMIVSFESHSIPSSAVEVHTDGSTRPFFGENLPPVGFSHSISTLSLTASADDGIQIPYTVLSKGKALDDHYAPAIVTAYGGNGVGLTPKYSAFIHSWTSSGGIFVIANIRGGNEFGQAWHDVAYGAGREIAFLDLRSVLDDMVRRGYTEPKRVGLAGGSNAGTLVCYAMTHWPEKIRAVVCLAPFTDLLRFDRQKPEYTQELGSPQNPDDFEHLLRFSPYHRALSSDNYPAILMISGAKDEICAPYHAFKFVAALQGSTTSSQPILLDFDNMRGHYAALPLESRIQALARRVVFMRQELTDGMPFSQAIP